jgi:hypothetical protein
MRIRSEILAVVAMGAAGAFAQDYPTPAFTAPMLRDIVSAVANAAPAPVKPAAPKTAPPPEPVTTEGDDEDEDEAWPGYVFAIALAGLALVVWGVFRIARRTRVNTSGERDASGDRP